MNATELKRRAAAIQKLKIVIVNLLRDITVDSAFAQPDIIWRTSLDDYVNDQFQEWYEQGPGGMCLERLVEKVIQGWVD